MLKKLYYAWQTLDAVSSVVRRMNHKYMTVLTSQQKLTLTNAIENIEYAMSQINEVEREIEKETKPAR